MPWLLTVVESKMFLKFRRGRSEQIIFIVWLDAHWKTRTVSYVVIHHVWGRQVARPKMTQKRLSGQITRSHISSVGEWNLNVVFQDCLIAILTSDPSTLTSVCKWEMAAPSYWSTASQLIPVKFQIRCYMQFFRVLSVQFGLRWTLGPNATLLSG